MIITKENLLADREGLKLQAQGINTTINYIDGLLAFLEKADPIEAVDLVNENPDLGDAHDIS